MIVRNASNHPVGIRVLEQFVEGKSDDRACEDLIVVTDDHLDVMPIPSGLTEVVITSDGYPSFSETLGESGTALAEMVRQDPAAIGELWSIGNATKPGANALGDRAYLRFRPSRRGPVEQYPVRSNRERRAARRVGRSDRCPS